MQERPIQLADDEARAMLRSFAPQDQLRIPLTPQPKLTPMNVFRAMEWSWESPVGVVSDMGQYEFADKLVEHCPFGKAGVRLFGQEAFLTLAYGRHFSAEVHYRADRTDLKNYSQRVAALKVVDDVPGHFRPLEFGEWREAKEMPEWASRFSFELQRVRAQLVRETTESEAQHLGWDMSNLPEGHAYDGSHHALDWFHEQYEKRYGVGAYNTDWVWVLDLKRMEG
jgi:hypothetical protein